MNEKKKKLLSGLETFFKNDDTIDEVSLFTSEELGASVDVLRCLVTGYGPGLHPVMIEYFFLPVSGKDILYFSSVLTIRQNLPKVGLTALSGAISRLNFYLPCGAFSFSSNGDNLIYKNVIPLPSKMTEKQLGQLIELAADTALFIPESYVEPVLKVAYGDLTLDEFIESLPK